MHGLKRAVTIGPFKNRLAGFQRDLPDRQCKVDADCLCLADLHGVEEVDKRRKWLEDSELQVG